MPTTFPITGVASNYRTPGQYAEILFAQGAATGSSGVRAVILVMPMLSTGSWTVNTVNPIRSEKDASDGAGVGSPLHRAARALLANNKTAQVYGLPYAETSGAGAVAATGTVTLTGTASGSGLLSATVCGVNCSVGIKSGDTPTVIGDALADSVNAKTWLPLTAANVAGVITLTAKLKGKSQGDGTMGVLRFRASITSGITTTVATSGAALGLPTGVAGADGSTTEAANLAAALAIINAARYYYIGCSVVHSAEVGSIKTHINTKSQPRPGLRSVGVVASVDTLANAKTLANANNFERLQLVWQKNSEHDPAELVGSMLAVRQVREELDPAFNFDSYRQADWAILPAFAVADWPSTDDMNDGINDGVTPIGSDQAGSFIVYSATTRSKNSSGTVHDPRVLESHRVSVADAFADECLSFAALNYSGKKLKDDQRLADNSVNNNQRIPVNTVTPSTFKPWIKKKLRDYEDAGKLQDAVGSINGLGCVIDPFNAGRLQVGCDLHVIDLLHQSTFRFAETSTG